VRTRSSAVSRQCDLISCVCCGIGQLHYSPITRKTCYFELPCECSGEAKVKIEGRGPESLDARAVSGFEMDIRRFMRAVVIRNDGYFGASINQEQLTDDKIVDVNPR